MIYESKKNVRAKVFQIIIKIFFLAVIIICLVPILNVVSISFSGKLAVTQGKVGIFPVDFNLDAYKKVFTNSSFMSSFTFSILLTLGHTFLAMCMTVMAAYPLSKYKLPGRKIIMTLLILTMYFDPGIIPHYLNMQSLNLLNTVWVLLIPGALSAYNMIILRSFFTSIDASLYESAHIDGASEWRAMFNIAIPLAKPSIATLSLFYAVGRWNGVSDVIYYISDSKFITVQVRLKQYMEAVAITMAERADPSIQLVAENIKAASIVFSMVPMLIVYPFIQKYFTQGVMLGAVKG